VKNFYKRLQINRCNKVSFTLALIPAFSLRRRSEAMAGQAGEKEQRLDIVGLANGRLAIQSWVYSTPERWQFSSTVENGVHGDFPLLRRAEREKMATVAGMVAHIEVGRGNRSLALASARLAKGCLRAGVGRGVVGTATTWEQEYG